MTVPEFVPWNPAHRTYPHAFWHAPRESLGMPSTAGTVTGRTGHLGFGPGIRRCLGAPLAHLEDQVVFAAIARIRPRVELVCDESDRSWTPDSSLGVPATLPMPAPMA